MKAVVFTSESGFTKKYAEILSAKTGLPVYDLKTAKATLVKSDEIVYLGWIMAGLVKGYKKAAKLFAVKAVCAVGMGAPGSQTPEKIQKQNHIDSIPAFYLQGGFDINKLHGLNKFMMGAMSNGVVKKLADKPDKTDEEKETLNMMQNGGDYVKEENLAEVLVYLSKTELI